MAASERGSGYQCQFISEVSDDLLCGTCRLVAREPHSTSCCGEHFCKACITQVLDASKPCPFCNEAEFVIFPDVRDQKRILALQVCCTMKDRGCEWVGKLEDLQAHLNVDTNDCQYVDIQCPDNCGKSVPRNHLLSHLADSCLNRDYFCKYCHFSATYRVVCHEHMSECPHYPVQCPNACSVGAVERGDLEDHIKVCLLQEVSCELSHAGCKDKFLREDEDRHMEENTQKHLLLMSAMSQRMCQEFEEKLQKQREEKEREIAEVKQERDEQMRALELETNLREKKSREREALRDKQIKQLQAELENLVYQLQVRDTLQHVPYQRSPLPVCFTVNNFHKLEDEWTSPDVYTHKGGYSICFKVYPSVPYSTSGRVGVNMYAKPGEFDDQLKWPVKATITLQFLNQCRDQDHIIVIMQRQWKRPVELSSTGAYQSIPSADLEWSGSRHTQYLKNDNLIFRLTKVELK